MTKLKKPIIIIIIIAVALLLAILADLVLSLVESASHPIKYEAEVTKYADEYNIPVYIVYAIIDVESDFNPEASSGKAYGLMQMTPDTFEWLTSNAHLGENLAFSELYNPDVSIRYGCYYLRYLRERFDNWDTVLAAYNAGPTRVANEWLKNPSYSSDGKTLKKIPFVETRNYVKKVNQAKRYYRSKILF